MDIKLLTQVEKESIGDRQPLPEKYLRLSDDEMDERIAAARRTYNAAATGYNIVVESVPTNLLAGTFGFGRRTLFEATAEDRSVPRVAGLA